jgi:hypothetical protein
MGVKVDQSGKRNQTVRIDDTIGRRGKSVDVTNHTVDDRKVSRLATQNPRSANHYRSH